MFCLADVCKALGFNRYIVECKYADRIRNMSDEEVLIDT